MRVLVAVIALAVAGFLAVQERGARAADRIAAAVTADPDPARLRRATEDLAAARRWNPDTTPELSLALVEARAGRWDRAGERIAAVTRAEPRNARAWQLLCVVAKRYDSGLAATACGRARELAPPVASLRRSSGRSTA
jgi:hypothetical protein